jgi:hypothetical protein
VTDIRTAAREAALRRLLATLEPYAARDRYELPFKITAGWGEFDCYCQKCAIAEVGELRAIGIEDGDDADGEIYAAQANECEVCGKPLQFKLTHKGVAHEILEYERRPPKEATPRAAYVLCAIIKVMLDAAYTDDFDSETYAKVAKFGVDLCALIDAEPQLELFPMTTS